jgi:SSS family solute:Na+ symporter
MASVLSNWRQIPQVLLLLFIPICAYTVLHHADFAAQAAKVQSTLGQVNDNIIESQLTVPLVLTQFLPMGLMGAFTAVMLMASISTLESYMHSWGSILVQDFILPLRKKSFTPKQHINVLRLAIIGVAVFVFFFSLLFKQNQYILLFFAITGAIYAGGSGTVIIGGLYWKRGTAAAAWAAMITGSVISVGGIIAHQLVKDFPINGQVFWFIAMASSMLVYIAVSLLGKRHEFDMDKLLHRGKYSVQEDQTAIAAEPVRGLKVLGMSKEFTRGDKIIYIASYVWIFLWFLVFVAGTIYNLSHPASDETWMKFWYVYLAFNIAAATAVVIWFTIGGVKNMREMFAGLRTRVRDHSDDGSVRREELLKEHEPAKTATRV